MSYTQTTVVAVVPFGYPRGLDNTQVNQFLRGNLSLSGVGDYTPGGIGSSAFEVTAFSAAGVVTFSALVGATLYNGQTVVVYNTASNTNDGTYTISGISYTSTTAGTFTANAIPGFSSISGTGQTTQTAQGVGQMQFTAVIPFAQTLTVTAVTASVGTSTLTYTTLTGPQLQPGQKITVSGMTNAGNNGTFVVKYAIPTSITAGSVVIFNSKAVTTDSGTATGTFQSGLNASGVAQNVTAPSEVDVWSVSGPGHKSPSGYLYTWSPVNQTIQIYQGAASASNPQAELALGTALSYDVLQFVAVIPKQSTS